MDFIKYFFIVYSFNLSFIATGDALIRPLDTEIAVGKTIQLNCQSSDKSAVRWYHFPIGSTTRNEVFSGNEFLSPYKKRCRITGDHRRQVYNLVIRDAQFEDSGRYECTNEGEYEELGRAEVTVLASPPHCQYFTNSEGVIGDNDCGIEPEEIEFYCSIRYSGNVRPVFEWRRTGGNLVIPKSVTFEEAANQVIFTTVIRPQPSMKGLSYTCQTSLSKSNWTSGEIKVLYVYNTSALSIIVQPRHEICTATSNQPCDYSWIRINSTDGTKEILNTGPSFYVDKPDVYVCVAKCRLREHMCTVQPKTVEYGDSAHDMEDISEITKGQMQSMMIILGTILIGAIIIGVGFVVFKINPRAVRAIQTLPGDFLLQGMAILDKELFVIYRGLNTVFVFESKEPHKFRRKIREREMYDPKDIAVCPKTSFLYITDAVQRCIWKMEILGPIVKTSKWKTEIERPFTLSVNSNGHVLLPQQPNKIIIYDSEGAKLKQIIQLSQDINELQHVVQFSTDHFIVSHGENNSKKHEVLMVSNKGKTKKVFGGDFGHSESQLYHPRHVAVSSRRVFVADKGNNQVIVLDKDMDVVDRVQYTQQDQPFRVYCRKEQLVIGRYRAIDFYEISAFKKSGTDNPIMTKISELSFTKDQD